MPIRREVTKPDHLSRILDAASELFLEIGFARTTITHIAKRAMVSKREIYLHFADRRAVLSGCITKLQGDVATEMDMEWASEGDLRSILTHAGNTIFKLILSEKFRTVFRLVAAASFDDPDAARQFYRLGPGAGRRQTARFFKRRIAQGQIIPTDPLHAADDFLDLVIPARLMTSVALGNTETFTLPKDHVAHAVDIFLRYYSASPPEPSQVVTGSRKSKVRLAAPDHELVKHPRTR